MQISIDYAIVKNVVQIKIGDLKKEAEFEDSKVSKLCRVATPFIDH